MQNNPFTDLPLDYCGDESLPAFPDNWNCSSYPLELSEVCGLILLPDGGVGVGGSADWSDYAEWDAIFDNTGGDATAPRYIAGIGSFLPSEKSTVNLASGRLIENRGRTYRLNFTILNMDEGHADFGRKLERNNKAFRFWLHTLGNRVIGGPNGMFPAFVDADFPFAAGTARETISLIFDAKFLSFPKWKQ
jgi:hypothetical protein